jgi:hypothetical protein
VSRLVSIALGGDVEPWQQLGLSFSPGERRRTMVGTVELVVVGGEPGIRSWTFAGVGDESGSDARSGDGSGADSGSGDGSASVSGPTASGVVLDGMATWIDGDDRSIDVVPVVHDLGATSIDHIVIMTSSLDRTCGALREGLGLPLKRLRDVRPGMRQGFLRSGEVIIEVVESADFDRSEAAFWGMVFVVDDLASASERLGPDVVGTPKAAVQPGRFISTVRAAVGLGVPVALMS